MPVGGEVEWTTRLMKGEEQDVDDTARHCE